MIIWLCTHYNENMFFLIYITAVYLFLLFFYSGPIINCLLRFRNKPNISFLKDSVWAILTVFPLQKNVSPKSTERHVLKKMPQLFLNCIFYDHDEIVNYIVVWNDKVQAVLLFWDY